MSKKWLASRLCEGISLSYRQAGCNPPPVVWAHSAHGFAVSMALFSGVCVKDICALASWTTACPFIRFCLLDMSDSFSKSVFVCNWSYIFKTLHTFSETEVQMDVVFTQNPRIPFWFTPSPAKNYLLAAHFLIKHSRCWWKISWFSAVPIIRKIYRWSWQNI